MKKFIGASSALLLAWLGATYMHQVPSERYPSQTRSSLQSAAPSETPDDEMIASLDSEISEN